MTDTEKILSYLVDEEFRYIYEKLLGFNHTSNPAAMRAIIDRYVPALKGTYHYTGIENEISEKIIIKSPRNVDYNKRYTFVISPCNYDVAVSIHNQLKGYGVADNFMIFYRNYCFSMTEKEQYFDRNIIHFEPREVLIDARALNLYTSKRFVEECAQRGAKKYKIVAFEPDYMSYRRCQDRLKEIPDLNIELHNVGIWSCNTTLHFSEEGNGDSRIVQQDTGTSCKVISLDSFLTDEVTFIKMDIEGAELEALKGSERIIKQYKPKMAVCIYHKKADLTDIPLFIKSLVPEYRMYIRHYSNSMCETVLYAVL